MRDDRPATESFPREIISAASAVASEEVTAHFHPGIYAAMGFCALVFVVAAWGFSGDGYAAYLILIVTGLFVIGAVIAAVLWHEWKTHRAARPDFAGDEGDSWSFARWARSWVDAARRPERGATAAIESLTPIVAVAFGMVLLEVVVKIFGV